MFPITGQLIDLFRLQNLVDYWIQLRCAVIIVTYNVGVEICVPLQMIVTNDMS